MKPDRFLTAIIAGLAVLAAAAVIVYFTQQKQANYTSENTAVGTLQNYIIAVQKGDYEQAYSLIAEGLSKPTLEQFRADLSLQQPQIDGVTFQIGDQKVNDDASVTIQVQVNRSQSLFFDTMAQDIESAELVRQNGLWKLKNFVYPYWYWGYFQTPEPVKN